MIASEKKRLVLHLILAGCKTEGISEVLGITEKIIKRWEKLHLKELKGVLPEQSLLAIHTLLKIYNAIEKKRIAAIHFSSWRKNRLRRN